MKHIIFISAHPEQDTPQFERILLRETGPALAERCSGCIVNLVDALPVTRWNAIVEIWLDDKMSLASLNLAQSLGVISELACYSVSEHLEKTKLVPGSLLTPAVKQIAAWERRLDINAAEARRHWDEHVPLANRVHIGCMRYVRHWVRSMTASRPSPPYQGIAFQYFLTVDDLQNRMFDSPESVQQIVDDTSEFIERFDVFVCREHVLNPPRAVS
ncbi:EthD domain-containing protein [Pseudomonas sp. GB2N2]